MLVSVDLVSFSAERNFRANYKARLTVVKAVNHVVREREAGNVRGDPVHFAGPDRFLTDILDRTVVEVRLEIEDVISALALPGDVDECVHFGLHVFSLGGF